MKSRDVLGYAIEFSGEREIFSRYGKSGKEKYADTIREGYYR